MLRVRGLTAWQGTVQVLDGLDFDLASGTLTALLGANGAGKSSLLRRLLGQLAGSGVSTLAGKDFERVQRTAGRRQPEDEREQRKRQGHFGHAERMCHHQRREHVPLPELANTRARLQDRETFELVDRLRERSP